MAARNRKARGLICPVNQRNRKVRQLVVGGFFLVEDLAEQLVRLIMPKILCPFPQRAIPGYLIVFDCLTSRMPHAFVIGRRILSPSCIGVH